MSGNGRGQLGRKTNLTRETIKQAKRFLDTGCFEKHVAAQLRIPGSTWEAWKAKGQQYRSRLEAGEWDSFDDLPANAKLYVEFREVIDEGRAKAVNVAWMSVRRIGQDGNWTALKWWLQVRDPETFGEQGLLTHDLRGSLTVNIKKEDRDRISDELEETFQED